MKNYIDSYRKIVREQNRIFEESENPKFEIGTLYLGRIFFSDPNKKDSL